MERMISYIFGNIENHEKAINTIAKVLKQQDRINKTVSWFAVTTTASLWLMHMQRKEDLKKIDKLTKEVEAMKEAKGE